MNLLQLKTVGRQIRDLVRQRIALDLAVHGYSNIGSEDDLCGACGYASWALWKVFPHSTRLVIGECTGLTHSWVETDNHIVDLTATQFGRFSPVRIISKTGRASKTYAVDCQGPQAEGELKSWYEGNWQKELVSLLQQEGIALYQENVSMMSLRDRHV